MGLARFYAISKGFALDQDFRPDGWERAGQTLIVACLPASFAGLLVAIPQVPFRPAGFHGWPAWLAMVAASAAFAILFVLAAYSFWRGCRKRTL